VKKEHMDSLAYHGIFDIPGTFYVQSMWRDSPFEILSRARKAVHELPKSILLY